MILLLFLALPFTLYYAIRSGIGWLKKRTAKKRKRSEIAAAQ
jgi:hypothetical protein